MNLYTKIFLLVVVLFAFILIYNNKNKSTGFKTITSEEAKEMIENNPDITIVDVRTLEEYNSGHIESAILLPDNEIAAKAESILQDKNATILVYCRSGRRSASASRQLSQLGYNNVYDFGGIINWKYDVVK